jgi:hypothetical protein
MRTARVIREWFLSSLAAPQEASRQPWELNLAITYALGNTLREDNKLEAPGQQRIELEMDEWELELGWGWKL